MPRFFTLLLVLSAANPALASADECMLLSVVGSGEISGISVDDPLVAVFGNESVDVALELRLGIRQLPIRGAALGTNDEGGLLFCLSPNDPRCSPVDGPTRAPSPMDWMPSSTAPATPAVAVLSPAAKSPKAVREVGPSGIATRVERPPRS
jgi:hypothetical protein